MASLARELEEVVETKFKDSIDSLSRGTLHLTLLYHRVSSQLLIVSMDDF